jgi:hypothetical protein
VDCSWAFANSHSSQVFDRSIVRLDSLDSLEWGVGCVYFGLESLFGSCFPDGAVGSSLGTDFGGDERGRTVLGRTNCCSDRIGGIDPWAVLSIGVDFASADIVGTFVADTMATSVETVAAAETVTASAVDTVVDTVVDSTPAADIVGRFVAECTFGIG